MFWYLLYSVILHRILNQFYIQVCTILYFYLYKTPVLERVTLPNILIKSDFSWGSPHRCGNMPIWRIYLTDTRKIVLMVFYFTRSLMGVGKEREWVVQPSQAAESKGQQNGYLNFKNLTPYAEWFQIIQQLKGRSLYNCDLFKVRNVF